MNNELKKNVREAIKKNDLSAVKSLIENNEGLLDVVTPFGTWLQVASSYGQIDIVKYFISSGIDVNKSEGMSDGGPIKIASFNGHLNIVKLLCDNGAILDVSKATTNPLFAAIYNGHIDIVKFLVEKGIDLYAVYAIGELPQVNAYEYARQYGQIEIANYLKDNM